MVIYRPVESALNINPPPAYTPPSLFFPQTYNPWPHLILELSTMYSPSIQEPDYALVHDETPRLEERAEMVLYSKTK